MSIIASVNISDYKMAILSDLINSDEVVKGIDSRNSNVHFADDLIYHNIWPFYQTGVMDGTDVRGVADTYILIKVDQFNSITGSNFFVRMRINIMVLAHRDRMTMLDDGISATRIDYLADVIKKILNGSNKYGFGELRCQSNVEYVLAEKSEYLYRELEFRTYDVNELPCDVG